MRRRRRIQENEVVPGVMSPALKEGYLQNLKSALQHIENIKASIADLDDVVNNDFAAALFTLDHNKYPELSDWFPNYDWISPLEGDIRSAISDLSGRMREGTRKKITRLVKEELRKILREDDRDYSPYDKKSGESDQEYRKRLEIEKEKLEGDLDTWETDSDSARSGGMLTVDVDIKSRQIRDIDRRLRELGNSSSSPKTKRPDPSDQFDRRASPGERSRVARE